MKGQYTPSGVYDFIKIPRRLIKENTVTGLSYLYLRRVIYYFFSKKSSSSIIYSIINFKFSILSFKYLKFLIYIFLKSLIISSFVNYLIRYM